MIDRPPQPELAPPLERRIAAALALRGVRHRDLAEPLGLSHWAISRRMAGQVGWSAVELERLARHLDCSLDALAHPAASAA